jgi:hypothetical protein
MIAPPMIYLRNLNNATWQAPLNDIDWIIQKIKTYCTEHAAHYHCNYEIMGTHIALMRSSTAILVNLQYRILESSYENLRDCLAPRPGPLCIKRGICRKYFTKCGIWSDP